MRSIWCSIPTACWQRCAGEMGYFNAIVCLQSGVHDNRSWEGSWAAGGVHKSCLIDTPVCFLSARSRLPGASSWRERSGATPEQCIYCSCFPGLPEYWKQPAPLLSFFLSRSPGRPASGRRWPEASSNIDAFFLWGFRQRSPRRTGPQELSGSRTRSYAREKTRIRSQVWAAPAIENCR